MAIKLLLKFPVFVLFYREMNSKSGKIYLLATMNCTWFATSVTAAEFCCAVIPSDPYVPVNSAVVHS